MAGTHRWNKAEPRPGTEFLSDTVGRNVRELRQYANLSQQDLAERMAALGYTWYATTVGQVERGMRPVSVEELLCLGLALDIHLGDILSPLSTMGQPTEEEKDDEEPSIQFKESRVRGIDIGPGSEVPDLSATEVHQLISTSESPGQRAHLVDWQGNRPRKRESDPLEQVRVNLALLGFSTERIEDALAALSGEGG